MSPRYSLDRNDKKIAGVASTLGDVFNIDPTIVRIAFVAIALLISIKLAIIAYIGAGIYLHTQRHRADKLNPRRSEFDRMADVGKVRPSVHAIRTELDETDRRMMAIDHHIAAQKDHELAREIEALWEHS